MNRPEILDTAKKCVCGDREHDCSKPEDDFSTVGLLWGVYLRAAHPDLARVMGVNLISPKDVAVMMALLKVARAATGNSPDTFVDLAGYAACAGEIATHARNTISPGTHDPVTCGCQSCGGRAIPADDLETRRKIERYRSKRHG